MNDKDRRSELRELTKPELIERVRLLQRTLRDALRPNVEIGGQS